MKQTAMTVITVMTAGEGLSSLYAPDSLTAFLPEWLSAAQGAPAIASASPCL